MKSDFKQKLKSAYYKDFFLRTKNEIEDSDDQPSSVLTKIYTDILFAWPWPQYCFQPQIFCCSMSQPTILI